METETEMTTSSMLGFLDGYLQKSAVAKGYKEQKVMHEFKHGELRSGSKTGPKVKSRKQAIAIAMSEARKAGEPVGKAPKS